MHLELFTHHSRHRKVSKFLKFIANEAFNLSVGYLAGLCASMLVSRFFVKKGISNLWGLAAKREAIQKDDYDMLMFVSSYAIGLVVMLAVTYSIQKWRGQKMVS